MISITMIIKLAITLLVWAIVIRCIISFFPYEGPLVDALERITDPFLVPMQKALSHSAFTRNLHVDISPAIVIAILEILSNIF